MHVLSIIGLVCLCAALLGVAALVSVRLMGGMFKRRSGYGRLAATFGRRQAPPERSFRSQTVQIGEVRYTRAVTVGVDDEGLFLQVVARSLGRHRALLIPWGDVRAVYPAALRSREAARLVIDDRGAGALPAVVVPVGLYAEFRNRLAQAAPLL